MGFLGIGNAIAWAHFQLRGGWRKTLSLAALAGSIALVLIVLTTRLDPSRAGAVYTTWTAIFLGANAVILVMMMTSRIGAAIGGDITSGMLESHRLMPLAPASAIAGYFWGGSAQPLMLAGTMFLLGSITAVAGGITLDRWIIPNLILLEFSLFAAIAAMVVAMFGQAGSAVGVVIALGALGFGVETRGTLLPGLILLISPILGDTAFGWRTRTVEVSWPLAASMSAHVIIGSMFFLGAVRRYRRSDQPALAVVPALVLLGAWVAVSAVATSRWDDVKPTFVRTTADPPAQVLASLTAAMLLSCIPLNNASKLAAESRLRRRIDPQAPRKRIFPPLLAAVLAAGIMLALPLATTILFDRRVMFFTAIILLAHCLSFTFLVRILHGFIYRPLVLTLWIIVLWGAPVMIDLARGKWMRIESVLSEISSFSPIGGLINIWYFGSIEELRGVWLQALLAGILGLIYFGLLLSNFETRARAAHEQQ